MAEVKDMSVEECHVLKNALGSRADDLRRRLQVGGVEVSLKGNGLVEPSTHLTKPNCSVEAQSLGSSGS